MQHAADDSATGSTRRPPGGPGLLSSSATRLFPLELELPLQRFELALESQGPLLQQRVGLGV